MQEDRFLAGRARGCHLLRQELGRVGLRYSYQEFVLDMLTWRFLLDIQMVSSRDYVN